MFIKKKKNGKIGIQRLFFPQISFFSLFIAAQAKEKTPLGQKDQQVVKLTRFL